MTILLPTLIAAAAALCLWLGVRIVNRRERWAKWTAVGLVFGMPVLYFASFGPACWIESRRDNDIDEGFDYLPLYRPIEYIWERAPTPIANVINRYCYAYASPDWDWLPLEWRHGASCFYPFGFWRLEEQDQNEQTPSPP